MSNETKANETQTVVKLPAGNGQTGKIEKQPKEAVAKGRNGRSCATHLSNAIRDLEYAIEMEPSLAKVFENVIPVIEKERNSRKTTTNKTPEQLQAEAQKILNKLSPEQRAQLLKLQA